MAREEVQLSSKLTAEFIGTFFLVFTVCCNVLSGTSGAFVALSIAASLMVYFCMGERGPLVLSLLCICTKHTVKMHACKVKTCTMMQPHTSTQKFAQLRYYRNECAGSEDVRKTK